MKRIISSVLCALTVMVAFTACEPKETPDGRCKLTAFSLLQKQNNNLPYDINGTIDATAKTIALTIPTSVGAGSFVPTFTATDYDVVKIGGTELISGSTSAAISDGTKVSLTDEVSGLTNDYTIVITDNDEKAELTAVSFKLADNELLKEDVAPEAISENMLVRVPGAAFQKELMLTVAGGFNDEVSVNNEKVSGAVKVDTSFPIDITVTDAVAGATASYVLKVGKILEIVVTKLGTYTEGTLGSDVDLAVSPADNLPYFGYVRKVEGDKNNFMSVAKWDGAAFSLVGKSGFNGDAKAASKPQIAFAADGTLYAKYIGGEVANRPTIRKYVSEWEIVGGEGFTSVNNNTSYTFPFFVNPANSQPALYYNGNTKSTPSYRTMNFAGFNGDSWAENVVTGTVPAYGSGSTASSGMYYGSSVAVVGGKAYLGSSFNEFGYYVHEVNADGTLNTIVDNFIPEGEKCGLPGTFALKADSKGILYFWGAVWQAGIMQLWKVADGSFTAYGDGVPVTISSSGSVSNKSAFGIGVSDLFVSIVENGDKIPVFKYLNDQYQWVDFTMDAPVAAKSACSMAADKDGNLFVAYISADGIELYRIGLEADIIPE